jgi:hypothetical protein
VYIPTDVSFKSFMWLITKEVTVVNRTTRLRNRQSRVRNPAETPPNPNQLSGPPSLLFIGCYASFPSVKLLRRDADQKPLSRAEVRNE